jgi:hypothetical protein
MDWNSPFLAYAVPRRDLCFAYENVGYPLHVRDFTPVLV